MSLKRPVGRPKGEETTVINVRVPVSLVQRLDRYVDRMEVETGASINRGMVMRNALKTFLESKELAYFLLTAHYTEKPPS